MNLDLDAVRTAVFVSRLGSLQAASLALGLTETDVRKQIETLEDTLGVHLFRPGKSDELTPAAAALATSGGLVLYQLAGVGRPGIATGPMNFGVFANGAAEYTETILHAVAATVGRNLRLVPLDFVNQYSALAQGIVEAAIVRPPVSHNLAHTNVLEESTVIHVGPKHELAEATKLTIADVLHYPFIDVAGPGSPWLRHWYLERFRNGPPRRVGPLIATLEEQIAFPSTSPDAITNTAASVAATDQSGRTVYVPLVDDRHTSTVALAYRPGFDPDLRTEIDRRCVERLRTKALLLTCRLL